MSEHRAKPLNAKTRESLAVAIVTIHDEFVYLNDAVTKQTLSPALKARLTIKRDHLQRAGQWLESKLISTEE